jgi:tetratricopeptide (TPR) repeat protein
MPGSKCIDCHMPKTRFANMNRSDQSMLPPTPALTVKYRSPNACNLCHKERSAAWADAQVRKWHKKDYQKPVLERAALVDAARRRDWTKLPAMLAYVDGAGGDDVVKASLIRLLVPCEDKSKWPVLIRALGSANPLVRAAAAGSFAGYATPETREALARAAGDEYRLVRIRAAASLAGVPVEALPPAQVEAVRKATGEMISAYQARPDDFANHTNLGNYYMERGELDKSIASFETALRLRPDSVGTLVNASIAYGRAGRTAEAVAVLDRALKESPDNAPANFNKGLLLAEAGRKTEAEAALKRAVKSDATLAPAAYNLGVLLLQEKRPEGMEYLRQAVKSAPLNEKYVFSLAFYLDQARQPGEALRALEGFAKQHGGGFDTRMLLAELQLKNGKIREAEAVYREALQDGRLDVNQRRFAQEKMRALGRGGV